ncbi:MAG: peptidylprolyl isomerase [Coriobacteriia bacterium]
MPSNGQTVRVHYRGTLDDGSEFDSSAGRDPLQFTLGSGQIIPGFEHAVSGLAIGDTTSVRLSPEDAYGERVEEAVQIAPLEAFAGDPYVGAVVRLVAEDGQELAATITAVGDESVTLDFNHPLAGQTLTFEIELVEVVET